MPLPASRLGSNLCSRIAWQSVSRVALACILQSVHRATLTVTMSIAQARSSAWLCRLHWLACHRTQTAPASVVCAACPCRSASAALHALEIVEDGRCLFYALRQSQHAMLPTARRRTLYEHNCAESCSTTRRMQHKSIRHARAAEQPHTYPVHAHSAVRARQCSTRTQLYERDSAAFGAMVAT